MSIIEKEVGTALSSNLLVRFILHSRAFSLAGCSPKSQGFIYVHSTRERCLSSRNYDQADGKGRYKHGDKCNWLL